MRYGCFCCNNKKIVKIGVRLRQLYIDETYGVTTYGARDKPISVFVLGVK